MGKGIDHTPVAAENWDTWHRSLEPHGRYTSTMLSARRCCIRQDFPNTNGGQVGRLKRLVGRNAFRGFLRSYL